MKAKRDERTLETIEEVMQRTSQPWRAALEKFAPDRILDILSERTSKSVGCDIRDLMLKADALALQMSEKRARKILKTVIKEMVEDLT